MLHCDGEKFRGGVGVQTCGALIFEASSLMIGRSQRRFASIFVLISLAALIAHGAQAQSVDPRQRPTQSNGHVTRGSQDAPDSATLPDTSKDLETDKLSEKDHATEPDKLSEKDNGKDQDKGRDPDKLSEKDNAIDPDKKLSVPKKIEDLQGCWKSARGDITVYDDNHAFKPSGTARFCYCFGDNGHGTARVRLSEHDNCSGPLTAQLRPNVLTMKHPAMSCFVAQKIICKDTDGAQTVCKSRSYGRHGSVKRVEQYVRATDEECTF